MLKSIIQSILPVIYTYSSIYLLYIITGYLFYYQCIPHSINDIFNSLISQLSPFCSGLNYVQGQILNIFQHSFGMALGYGVKILWSIIGK